MTPSAGRRVLPIVFGQSKLTEPTGQHIVFGVRIHFSDHVDVGRRPHTGHSRVGYQQSGHASAHEHDLVEQWLQQTCRSFQQLKIGIMHEGVLVSALRSHSLRGSSRARDPPAERPGEPAIRRGVDQHAQPKARSCTEDRVRLLDASPTRTARRAEDLTHSRAVDSTAAPRTTSASPGLRRRGLPETCTWRRVQGTPRQLSCSLDCYGRP